MFPIKISQKHDAFRLILPGFYFSCSLRDFQTTSLGLASKLMEIPDEFPETFLRAALNVEKININQSCSPDRNENDKKSPDSLTRPIFFKRTVL